MRTAGEESLSPVFASRAAAPHPTAHIAAAVLLAGCDSLCIIAASVPRGCNCASQAKKPARRQFSPPGKASCIMNPAGLQAWFRRITNHAGTHTDSFRPLERRPDTDCGRGKLFPRFRLASRSAASGDIPRSCNCASQTGKSLLAINSVRSARQSTRRFIPFNGSLCRETMGNLAGHQNTCERDTSRNRAHTAVHGRFCNPPGSQVGIGRQVLECPDCQLFEYFPPRTCFCAEHDSVQTDLLPSCPAFGLADFYPPPCFVKFIDFTLAVSTAFKRGSM